MEKSKGRSAAEGRKKDEDRSLDELGLEQSPYTNFDNVEDYKLKAYGTQGHQEPKPGRGAGATDAPTPSGSTVAKTEAGRSATDTMNQQGVP